MANNKKGMSTGAMIGVGAGIAAAAAAGYLLFGPDGKKNRKAIKGWAVKMKGEIIEKFEQVKDLTEPVYQKIVDEVQAKYSKMKNVDPKELQALVGEIRKHWKAVSKTTTKKSAPKVKKAASKASSKKKSVKK
ncbi:MAG: hypothetical protein V4665_01465 [Patescibacteria group bacterium]